MTQTQTTADRIQAIIEAGLFDFNARPSCEVIAAEIDALTAEAKRQEAELRAAHDFIAGLETQLAEARAGVERLRPAADAWELQRRYAAMFADNLRGRVSDVDLACLEAEYESAAARARAARGAKP